MKKFLFPLSTAFTLAFSFAALAQDPIEDKTHVRSDLTVAPMYERVGTLIGAKISLAPSAEERAEAAKEGEKPDRPNGKVKDFLVERETGDISYFVISTGGWLGIGDKVVAVPADQVTWDPREERFFTNATEDQLKRLRSFDLDDAKSKGLDASIVMARESWIVVAPDAGDKTKDRAVTRGSNSRTKAAAEILKGSEFIIVPVRFVLGSQLDDPKVRALDGDFGKVKSVVTDMNARHIEFLVVSVGGVAGVGDSEYLLPFEAVTLVTNPKDKDEFVYILPHSRAVLETAPKYHAPEHGVVTAEEARATHDWCARAMDEASKRRPVGKGGG